MQAVLDKQECFGRCSDVKGLAVNLVNGYQS
jgi:hypothetical protein